MTFNANELIVDNADLRRMGVPNVQENCDKHIAPSRWRSISMAFPLPEPSPLDPPQLPPLVMLAGGPIQEQPLERALRGCTMVHCSKAGTSRSPHDLKADEKNRACPCRHGGTPKSWSMGKPPISCWVHHATGPTWSQCFDQTGKYYAKVFACLRM